jgi:2-haloacid dehalogenase
MENIRVFLFDMGGVLVGWDTSALFAEWFPDPAERADFKKIFDVVNDEGDKGCWEEEVAKIADRYPAYKKYLLAYPDRYLETLTGTIEGTVEVLKQVKALGFKCYVASNWASDNFEVSKHLLSYLSLFDGIQISGLARLGKPDPAFFQKMMKDFNFRAEEAVFIDDNPANITAASKLGFKTIRFISPEKLKADLKPLIGEI